MSDACEAYARGDDPCDSNRMMGMGFHLEKTVDPIARRVEAHMAASYPDEWHIGLAQQLWREEELLIWSDNIEWPARHPMEDVAGGD